MKRIIAAIMVFCILAISLVGCGNTNNNAGNGNEAISTSSNDAAKAPTVQGLVIDTYAQGENLHSITDDVLIKKAYDIYCKYVEEKNCQKESSDNTKQLLTLTFKMTDGSEQSADFYQAGSGNYYMDKRNKGHSTVEKTVSITEEDFNNIKGLL